MSNPFEPIPVTNTLRPIAFGFDVPFWGHGGEGSRIGFGGIVALFFQLGTLATLFGNDAETI
jgi:hypothetical protein